MVIDSDFMAKRLPSCGDPMHTPLTFGLEGTNMSKMAAIDVAVRHQLAGNGHATDYNRVMGAAPGYGYDDNGIQLFLLNVANRLQLDQPKLLFDWRSLDFTRCLSSNLALLISHVESATRPPPDDTTRRSTTEGTES